MDGAVGSYESNPHDEALLINNTDRADSFEQEFEDQEVIL